MFRFLSSRGISTVFATNWYRFCDVHFCAFFAFFLAFCLHSVQRDAFSSCISERIFVHLKRIFAHLKALCCILSARTLLCLGVHLLCIHDAPFLDQCLMCILPAFLHFVFHDILTHFVCICAHPWVTHTVQTCASFWRSMCISRCNAP